MKSVRLNCDLREQIISSVMVKWKEENKAPYDYDDIHNDTALKIWNSLFGKIDFSTIPTKFLTKGKHIRVSVNKKVYNFILKKDKILTSKQTRWEDPILKNYVKIPSSILEYETKMKELNQFQNDQEEFRQEISAVINSVNTTKQLQEIWPEVLKFVPAHLINPSVGITLPAIKTDKINKSLGIE